MNKTIIGILIAAATTTSTAALAQPPPAPSAIPNWTPPIVPEPPAPPQDPAAAPYGYTTPAPAAAPYGYAPPAPAAPVAVVQAAAPGQWVYTNQYGWIWMPYSANYTYVAGADVAYSYAYYPRFGWRWVVAPWVLNHGPTPFWGRQGPSHYAWYGHPGFRGRTVVAGGWRARPVAPAPTPHQVAWRGNAGRNGGHHRR